MAATYTFDVFSSLDGFASYDEHGDWGGYWGKQGPEFLDHRLAVCSEEQRLVLGANTFRQFVEFLGPIEEPELDPVNFRMKTMPTTMVNQIGMFCFPGTTRRPSAPMIAPTTIAVMIPVTVMCCSSARMTGGHAPSHA